MASVEGRVAEWVDIARDLLDVPLGTFPVDLVNQHMVRSSR